MTRPLDTKRRVAVVLKLAALMEELDRDGAEDVQRLMGEALDFGYPATASGSTGGAVNRVDGDGVPIQPDTIPERLAIRPDRAAADAARLIRRIEHIANEAQWAAEQLAEWHRDRPVRRCGVCGHPLPPDTIRCLRTYEGRQCGAREDTVRSCEVCEREMSPGEPLRRGVDGVARCDKDRKYFERHQRDRVTTKRIALDDSVIVEPTGGELP